MRPHKKMPPYSKSKRIGDEAGAYIVPAADKAARILALLKSEAREMTIAEIADATGWHKEIGRAHV
jgi:hypothetical protein